MKRFLTTVLFLCFLASLPACSAPQTAVTPSPDAAPMNLPTATLELQPYAAADIIFFNGNVITIEQDQPLAEAVAVNGQLIQAVGSNDEILALQGPQTRLIDLQGLTLMPGFIDSHIHFTRNRWSMGFTLDEMQDVILSLGITMVTEMHSVDEYIAFMRDAEAAGQLRVRVNIFGSSNCGYMEDHSSLYCPSWYLDHDPILDPGNMVRIPGVKIFVDGAGTPERGCPYYTEPYAVTIMQYYPEVVEACGTPLGDLYLSQEELTTLIEDIQARGYRAAFHVMGDAGIDVTLNAVQNALGDTPNALVRHQIEHNSLVRPDQVQRYIDLDVQAGMAGQFNTCEANDYRIIFGPERESWNGTRYTLANAGIHASYQSDFNGKKVTDPPNYNGFNPIWGVFGLVTHEQIATDGSRCQPPYWLAENTATVQRALEMATIEGAWAVSMDQFTGSIAPGKFADLVILSGDPLSVDPEDIPEINVLMTMVGGVSRYCATDSEEFCPSEEEIIPLTPAGDVNQVQQVRLDCDARANSPVAISGQDFLQTSIDWAAMTSEQVNDFLANVHYVVYVNGVPVSTSMTSSPVAELEGTNYYHSLAAFDVGSLDPGSYTVRTVLSFDRKFTDGMGWYGPNTENPFILGTCTVMIGE